MRARVRLEFRMLVRALKLQLGEGGTLVGSRNALLQQKWASEVLNGQTVVSTLEAGGSVTFTFERGCIPAQLAVMSEEAIECVLPLTDPENLPTDVPHYHRPLPAFHKAVL